MSDQHPIVRALTAEAERIEEDCTYSFKQLYESAASLRRLHLFLGSVTAILSTLAGASFFAKWPHWESIGPALALMATVVSALATVMKPSEAAQKAKDSACQFEQLRDESRIFRSVELIRLDPEEKAPLERIKQLSAKLSQLRKDSPQFPKWAYARARRAIEAGETSYTTDLPHATKEDSLACGSHD